MDIDGTCRIDAEDQPNVCCQTCPPSVQTSTSHVNASELSSTQQGAYVIAHQLTVAPSPTWFKRNFRRPFIQNATVFAPPGCLTLVIGVGSTAQADLLLQVIGNRYTKKTVTPNSIHIVSEVLSPVPRSARKQCGCRRRSRAANNATETPVVFVGSDTNHLLSKLTVEETLYYAARLRFPQKAASAYTKQRVDWAINRLGLENCRNSYVGDTLNKSLSTGERKRLLLALELLDEKPSILLIEGVNSGIDNYRSTRLLSLLQNVARSNQKTIICSATDITEPMVEYADQLVVVAQGQTVFLGTPVELQSYCETELGLRISRNVGVLDFFMRQLEESEEPPRSKIAQTVASTVTASVTEEDTMDVMKHSQGPAWCTSDEENENADDSPSNHLSVTMCSTQSTDFVGNTMVSVESPLPLDNSRLYASEWAKTFWRSAVGTTAEATVQSCLASVTTDNSTQTPSSSSKQRRGCKQLSPSSFSSSMQEFFSVVWTLTRRYTRHARREPLVLIPFLIALFQGLLVGSIMFQTPSRAPTAMPSSTLPPLVQHNSAQTPLPPSRSRRSLADSTPLGSPNSPNPSATIQGNTVLPSLEAAPLSTSLRDILKRTRIVQPAEKYLTSSARTKASELLKFVNETLDHVFFYPPSTIINFFTALDNPKFRPFQLEAGIRANALAILQFFPKFLHSLLKKPMDPDDISLPVDELLLRLTQKITCFHNVLIPKDWKSSVDVWMESRASRNNNNTCPTCISTTHDDLASTATSATSPQPPARSETTSFLSFHGSSGNQDTTSTHKTTSDTTTLADALKKLPTTSTSRLAEDAFSFLTERNNSWNAIDRLARLSVAGLRLLDYSYHIINWVSIGSCHGLNAFDCSSLGGLQFQCKDYTTIPPPNQSILHGTNLIYTTPSIPGLDTASLNWPDLVLPAIWDEVLPSSGKETAFSKVLDSYENLGSWNATQNEDVWRETHAMLEGLIANRGVVATLEKVLAPTLHARRNTTTPSPTSSMPAEPPSPFEGLYNSVHDFLTAFDTYDSIIKRKAYLDPEALQALDTTENPAPTEAPSFFSGFFKSNEQEPDAPPVPSATPGTALQQMRAQIDSAPADDTSFFWPLVAASRYLHLLWKPSATCFKALLNHGLPSLLWIKNGLVGQAFPKTLLSGWVNLITTGSTFALIVALIFLSFETLFQCFQDRLLFNRETANGWYSPGAFLASKFLTDTPQQLASSLLLTLPWSLLSGLAADAVHGFWSQRFFVHTCLCYFVAFSAYGFCSMVSAASPRIEVSLVVAPLFLLTFIILAGFILRDDALLQPPVLLFRYLSLARYGFFAIMSNAQPEDGTFGVVSNRFLLWVQGIKDRNIWTLVARLLGLGFVFRFLGCVFLLVLHRQVGLAV